MGERLLATRNRRITAAAIAVLGGGATLLGLGASGAFESSSHSTATHEQPASPLVTLYNGKLCVNGSIYGAVHDQVESLPYWACTETAAPVPVEVFNVGSDLCVDGALYGVVNNQVALIPDSACGGARGGIETGPNINNADVTNESNVTNNNSVAVINNENIIGYASNGLINPNPYIDINNG